MWDLEHTEQERDALNHVMQNVEHRIFDAEACVMVRFIFSVIKRYENIFN